VQRATHNEV